jgi:TPR repeat protein
LFKPLFKFSVDDRDRSGNRSLWGKRRDLGETGARSGEASMTMEMGVAEARISADELFDLGMMHSSGRETAIDLVTAHKWFNVAAMKGHAEAARLRREVATEMTDAEIGQAQRAARDWLKAHPEPVVPIAASLRAAA